MPGKSSANDGPDGSGDEQTNGANGSEFMKSLGRYSRPGTGKKISTEYGTAEIIEVKDYDGVLEEMERSGVSRHERNGFTARVEHFLGDPAKYFECLIRYEDGEFDAIDWSEYLALSNWEKR
jgi:hypothetical protein